MLWIPGYAAYYIITTPGTLREVVFQIEFLLADTYYNALFSSYRYWLKE